MERLESDTKVTEAQEQASIDTLELDSVQVLRNARESFASRQEEERFYNQGCTDWVAGRRDTPAAIYWANDPAQSSY